MTNVYCFTGALRYMAVSSVKENGVKERELLSATGKQRMWIRYRGLGEINLEFGVSGGYFEHL
jgi:hypothetical protein